MGRHRPCSNRYRNNGITFIATRWERSVRCCRQNLVNKAKTVAARLLEANEADIVLDKDCCSISRCRYSILNKNLVRPCDKPKNQSGGLVHSDVIGVAGATFPFGAHVAVVEVDTETGKVTHLRHFACDDAGRVLNPLLLEGQIHGGVAQGTAQALLEEVIYDADGNPIVFKFGRVCIHLCC